MGRAPFRPSRDGIDASSGAVATSLTPPATEPDPAIIHGA
jgi:hypothetical protein